jgi:hypothetical protein
VSGSGLRSKDKTDHRIYPAIAVARLMKWLDQKVLTSQNLLVDAPHLVERFPSLISGDSNELKNWNQCATLGGEGLKTKIIAENEFLRERWLSRKTWWWTKVSNNSNVAEVNNPWEASGPDVVFCEDISQFLPREQAREFVADLPMPYLRRYVVSPDAPAYKQLGLNTVTYWPQVRFSM